MESANPGRVTLWAGSWHGYGMGRTVVVLLLVAGAALLGWGVFSRAEGDSQGLEALQKARLEARAVRYLDVRTSGCCDRERRRLSQRMQFAPGQYVYWFNGHITGWQKGPVSYGFKQRRGCYERARGAQFPDIREMRRDIVVPQAFVHEAEPIQSGGAP
jgi:hypothetical protein